MYLEIERQAVTAVYVDCALGVIPAHAGIHLFHALYEQPGAEDKPPRYA